MVNWIIWIAYVGVIASCLFWQVWQFIDWLESKAHRRNNIWYINQMRQLYGDDPLEMSEWSDYEVRSKADEIERFSKRRSKSMVSK